MKIYAADLFCGAGGTSSGLLLAAKQLRREVDLLAINHWNIAIDTHTRNHPGARHLCESLDGVDPRKAIPGGRLDLLCASPECTHHSLARGGKPRSDQSRATAWHILRWAEALRVENILIENVKEFQTWGPLTKLGKPMKRKKGQTFLAFIHALRSLDYTVEWRVLNAADYGDATSRHRLFIMARRNGPITWPKPSHAGKHKPARDILNFEIKGRDILNTDRPLKPRTMCRIAAGLKRFGGQAFLVKLYGTNTVSSLDKAMPTITAQGNHLALAQPFIISTTHHGGDRVYSIEKPMPTITCAKRGEMALIQPFIIKYYGRGENAIPISEPLPTITTKARFGLVQPCKIRNRLAIYFRMCLLSEYAAATSFEPGYDFAGNLEDQVKQVGNAVPVRTAAALCKELLK